MSMSYFRRYRMEIDFAVTHPAAPELPEGYRWLQWDRALLDRHAQCKFESFRFEIDSRVFPCLGEIDGCRRLMGEIASQKAFLPDATWLVAFAPGDIATPVDCGTIQGIAHTRAMGAVQNVGVAPEHRGCGLGRALVLKSLQGFRAAGVRRVYLEVTADNCPAVELYKALGFRLTRTMYKAVESEPVPSF